MIDQVATGGQEQSQGIEQIARALVQIDQVTQTTAANAEENAAAGKELSAQSEGLHDLAERLFALV